MAPRHGTVDIVMAYIVMACIAMAYIGMAYIVMAYIVMAHRHGTVDIARRQRPPTILQVKVLIRAIVYDNRPCATFRGMPTANAEG